MLFRIFWCSVYVICNNFAIFIWPCLYSQVTINQPIGMEKYPGVAKGLYVASQSGYFFIIYFFRLSIDLPPYENLSHVMSIYFHSSFTIMFPFHHKTSLYNFLYWPLVHNCFHWSRKTSTQCSGHSGKKHTRKQHIGPGCQI